MIKILISRHPMRSHAKAWVLLFLPLFLFAACEKNKGSQEPVKVVWDRDQCEECGMIISDERFAVQIIEADGRSHKFDDMGDAILWVESKPWKDQAKIWVKDIADGKWIEAEMARWRIGEVSPMGHGFGATLSGFPENLVFSQVREMVLAKRRQNHQAHQARSSKPEPAKSGDQMKEHSDSDHGNH